MNFSLLQENYPVLHEYGHGAEIAMHQNLQVYFVKLHCFAQAFVSYVFDELTLVKQPGETLEERLSQADFVASVPKEMVNKLRLLQLYGERAIHGDVNTLLGWQTKRAMKDAYLLGRWLFKTFVDTEREYPQYVLPMLSDTTEKVEPIHVKDELDRVHKLIGDVHTKIPYTMTQEERKAHNRECRAQGDEVIRKDTLDYEIEETEQCLAEVQSAIEIGQEPQRVIPMQQNPIPIKQTLANPSQAKEMDIANNTEGANQMMDATGVTGEMEAATPVEVDDFIDDDFVQRRVISPWYSLREEAKGLCRLLARMLGDRYYKISHVIEHDYHIVFTIKGDISHGTYKVYYKKTGTISKVMQHDSIVDDEIDAVIMGLKGFSVYKASPESVQFKDSASTVRAKRSTPTIPPQSMGQVQDAGNIGEAFLCVRVPLEGIQSYMKWIEGELQKVQIRIAKLERGQFYIRTTFVKGYQVAVFNLYYNRMGVVTSTIPLESKSTSVSFIEEVLDIINPSQPMPWDDGVTPCES